MKETILNYKIDSASADKCCDSIVNSIQQDRKGWLACFNPHSYVESLKDEHFSRALQSSEWLVADGVGVIYASKMLGGKVRERVTGSDIFSGVHSRLNNSGGGKVFFLGSTEETLAKIRALMAQDYPSLEVVGTYSPPFKESYSEKELNAMIQAINASKADVLWVGMTAPKQEKWIYDNFSLLNVKFAGAIGAVFDFYTGRVKRSHPIFQRLGLEWLPRLVQQPKRLWRRMLVSAPIFIFHTCKCKVLTK